MRTTILPLTPPSPRWLRVAQVGAAFASLLLVLAIALLVASVVAAWPPASSTDLASAAARRSP